MTKEINDDQNPQRQPDLAASITSLWRDSSERRRAQEQAMVEERDFMWRGAHYEQETAQERNQSRLKPRGRQTLSKHRHKLAEISKVKPHLDLRPLDPLSTQEDAEIVKAVMENEMFDPQRNYLRNRRRAISSMLASRMGAMGLDVDYRGSKPKVIPFLVDPLDLYWTPGWNDLDDPTCPWVIHKCRTRIDEITAMKKHGWKNTGKVLADDGDKAQKAGNQDASRDLLSNRSGQPAPGEWKLRDKATILKCWFRYDESTKTNTRDEQKTLAVSERYMACPDCGYEDHMVPGDQLPENGIPCPQCLQNPGVMSQLHRIDVENVTEDVLAYPHGRLVIVAPFSPGDGSSGLILYDDAWPWEMRNVPYMLLTCYEDPYEQVGTCDTTWDWDSQLVVNALMRKAYDQIMRSPSVIWTNGELTENDSDEPFEFTDDPLTIARWTGMGNPQMGFFQPDGMVNGLSEFYQIAENSLRSDLGTTDLNLTGESLKGVQVGVAQQAESTGEIPVADHMDQIQDREGNFIGVWSDIWRAINGQRVQIPVQASAGSYEWISVRGSDLKNFNFIITGGNEWKDVDKEKIEAAQMIISTPPQFREVIAEAVGISPAIVRKVMKAEQEGQGGPQPNKVVSDAMSALARIILAAKGSIGENQVQWMVQQMGCPPPEGISVAEKENVVNPPEPPKPDGKNGQVQFNR